MLGFLMGALLTAGCGTTCGAGTEAVDGECVAVESSQDGGDTDTDTDTTTGDSGSEGTTQSCTVSFRWDSGCGCAGATVALTELTGFTEQEVFVPMTDTATATVPAGYFRVASAGTDDCGYWYFTNDEEETDQVCPVDGSVSIELSCIK